MKQYIHTAIIGFGLAMAFSASAEIFKSIDKNGNVIYSDVPQQNAKPVSLPQATVYTAPAPIAISPPTATAATDTAAVVVYKSATISSPLNDASYVNEAADNISASVTIDPQLSPNDKILFLVDGKPNGAASQSTQITLTGLERGAHAVSATIVNSAGAMIKQSPPVTVHMKRKSALFKKGAR